MINITLHNFIFYLHFSIKIMSKSINRNIGYCKNKIKNICINMSRNIVLVGIIK
jgi:hypothetical protein